MINPDNNDLYDLNEALKVENLTINDYEEICKRLKRKPNRTELGMFGVMWSEHCCYRNSKPLLSNFPTKGKNILVGPGENAGVIDVGNNQKLVFKIESHNHPSAIEPFQGAATGVGGILRDIFTMGARPIAVLNSLRFGNLDKTSNMDLLRGVVSGIAHYGNCVGVPTVGGEIDFDDSYSGNPLVNVMALGLLETNEIVCSGAKNVGSPVLYVGNTTGRDGVGGASFASSELTITSLDDRPAVQVGDPFIEKSLIEACLDAFKTGDVIAAQDMGAAGLTCSSAEMAANGNLGISIDLDLVPSREDNMSSYQYLLSESQERMLFVVKEEKINNLIEKFNKWGLYANVIGEVIETNEVIISHKRKIVAQIPTSALSDDTPVNLHNVMKNPPNYLLKKWKWNENNLPEINEQKIFSLKENKSFSYSEIILKLLANPSIASKRWIYKQYDSQVQANTVFKPGESDAAVIRLREQNEKNKSKVFSGVAASVDCNSRWVSLDPFRGTIAAVAESARNVSCVGAEPVAITNNLNFSSPETEIGYWQLSSSCNAISEACKALETPVTGGNVSLYNESKNRDNEITPINPTPVIGMVGKIDNVEKAISTEWKNINDQIWLIGSHKSETTIAASSYLEYFHGEITGRPPKIDLQDEKFCQSFLRNAILNNFVVSSHDISDGGLAIALAECCILSAKGATIELEKDLNRDDNVLFSEGGSRIIFSIDKMKEKEWSNYLKKIQINSQSNVYVKKIGYVSSEILKIKIQDKNICDISVEELTEKFNNSISGYF
ncbi:phosphoribosylformylglycinamidine synthase subunit II [Prochlorococcus marinus str. MIT 9312]|uniref:Phosphoribosylformylglycinamidine synthase subunit PurL n=1 Tax=Prochlorococcus marinus (strain MIT 9312) TaxID=74546 RepID=PURL_PROM9|nr:phosphoribosylformylglycinamidine synthase subunit PurL [Prochlorococcus marinus]Q31DI1.1 RecName: Full=Phosphoribosylformylglycinamidine synthase subunit PurL; Short=FGAM synthase; AltName: Full=Formylglycinamide ribonucleotide amidotransferase subunit II; Short=FGAR amidotransferase II; Short=FGAR-AT II; AltName: Full=Glutamine amidotransferase PurL; AltName: Full=Phosphoribosylformylglycinamidine synthase subunit II [Prochlorococcus marinus str. MIT 9312]ABB49064.1 phosphoribosylformylglyci